MTPGKSGSSGAASTGAALVATAGSGTAGGGSAGPQATSSSGMIDEKRFIGRLREVLGGFHEDAVEAAHRDEVVVGALFDDAAVVHDDDEVRVANGGEAVRDGD